MLITETPAWNTFANTFYDEENRHRLEVVIGAISAGDFVKEQKIAVICGAPESGKTTTVRILKKLFYDQIPFVDDGGRGVLKKGEAALLVRNHLPHLEGEGLRRRVILIETVGTTIDEGNVVALVNLVCDERTGILKHCLSVYKDAPFL